jgi:hypothetical protein
MYTKLNLPKQTTSKTKQQKKRKNDTTVLPSFSTKVSPVTKFKSVRLIHALGQSASLCAGERHFLHLWALFTGPLQSAPGGRSPQTPDPDAHEKHKGVPA